MRLKRSGFTLIELLIVIAILGILAGIIVLYVNPGAIMARARDAQRKRDVQVIRSALEQYYADTGQYPPTHLTESGDGDGILHPQPQPTIAECPNGLCWKNPAGNILNFLDKIPIDPLGTGYWFGGNYYYCPCNGEYTVEACLENPNDNDPNDISQDPTDTDPSAHIPSTCPSCVGGDPTKCKIYQYKNP